MEKSSQIASKMTEAAAKILESGKILADIRKENESAEDGTIEEKVTVEEQPEVPEAPKITPIPTAEALGRMPSHEEICQADLARAKELGHEDPGFDFRTQYAKGQTIFYVYYSNFLMEKSIMQLKVRTIYPRMMVLTEEKGPCTCVSYKQRDLIFTNIIDAKTCYNNITLPRNDALKEA